MAVNMKNENFASNRCNKCGNRHFDAFRFSFWRKHSYNVFALLIFLQP